MEIHFVESKRKLIVVKYSYLFKEKETKRESSVVQQRGALCCGRSTQPVTLGEGQDV